jgi:hypothetical protein
MSNLDEIIKQLEETKTATYLEPIDITWGYQNQLVNTIEMLLLMLTKTSEISFISNYTETNIYSSLGISLEQATIIQESNEMLLQLHRYIIKYCIQEFTLASYLKKLMDDTILEMPEQNMDSLLEFINSGTQAGIQVGGGFYEKFLAGIFKIMILLMIVEASPMPQTESSDMSLQLFDENYRMNKGLLTVSVKNFQQELMALKERSSGPIEMNNMVAIYDAGLKEKNEQFMGSFLSLFNNQQEGQRVLSDIISNFNRESRSFSRSVEESCIELMTMSSEKGIFAEWKTLDDAEETIEKINKAKTAVDEKQKGNMAANLGAAAASAVSGDVVSAYAYVLDLGSDLSNWLSSSEVESASTEIIEQSSPTKDLTVAEKKILESNIFTYSTFYCSTGYNLQLDLKGTNVEVVGDKIEYLWMISLINQLESNLQFQISKISASKESAESKKSALYILTSLLQRLTVLKVITDSLERIVNYSFKLEMIKLAKYSDPKTMDEFKIYLDKQLDSLKTQLARLNEAFPLKAQALAREKSLIEEEIKLKSLQQDIDDTLQKADTIATQRRADRNAAWLQGQWNATRTGIEAMTGILNSATALGVESIVKFVKAPSVALLHEGLQFVNSILWEILSSPAGWGILIGGLIFVQFSFGGVTGSIRLFKKGGELFVAILQGSILFVYKLISTPFGYIYRQIATMHVNIAAGQIANAPQAAQPVAQIANAPQAARRAQTPQQAAAERALLEAEERRGVDYGQYGIDNMINFRKKRREGQIPQGDPYDPDNVYGGRRRKTRKNKKKRTRKMKGRKRRQTKHRKNRQTKKR